jgi:signal transduction histidine kinase
VPARARLWLALFWVLPGIVGAAGLQLVPSTLNPELSLGEVLLLQLLIWSAWGGWSLVILAACDHLPLDRRSWWWTLPAHLALAAVVIGGQSIITRWAGVLYGVSMPLSLSSTLAVGLRSEGDYLFVIYWGIVVAHTAFRWRAELEQASLQRSELERSLTQSQLDALRAQLNPHFLFNALNSVVALISRDAPAARRTVVRLAELLRGTLTLTGEQRVPLERELELARAYLDIEQVRFGDRLVVTWSLPDATGSIDVPALVLQPLVENAMVHAVAPVSRAVHVNIDVHRDDGMLTLTVTDDGAGPDAGRQSPGAGIGLANLRDRLSRLYGDAADVRLERNAGDGCTTTVRMPLGGS